MEQNWNVYMTLMEDDAPATVLVDFAAGDDPATSDLLELAVIEVAMKSPTEDGLPSDEDTQWLSAFEEWLEQNSAELGGRYVGRIATGGSFLLHFYCKSVHAAAQEIARGAGETLGCAVELGGGEDPEWAVYREQILPDDAEQQQINVMSILQQLVDAGDDLAAPRKVDFLSYFPDEGSLGEASTEIEELGYTIDDRAEPDDDEPAWSLRYSAEIALDPGDMIERCVELLTITQEHNGEFDGWGSPIAGKGND